MTRIISPSSPLCLQLSQLHSNFRLPSSDYFAKKTLFQASHPLSVKRLVLNNRIKKIFLDRPHAINFRNALWKFSTITSLIKQKNIFPKMPNIGWQYQLSLHQDCLWPVKGLILWNATSWMLNAYTSTHALPGYSWIIYSWLYSADWSTPPPQPLIPSAHRPWCRDIHSQELHAGIKDEWAAEPGGWKRGCARESRVSTGRLNDDGPSFTPALTLGILLRGNRSEKKQTLECISGWKPSKRLCMETCKFEIHAEIIE